MKLSENQPNSATPGFAIRLTDETDLGIAMLIAAAGARAYLPIGPVATIAEGREMAQHDFGRRSGNCATIRSPSARRCTGSERVA